MMIRVLSCLGLMLLTACAGPMADLDGSEDRSGLSEPAVEAAPIEATPVAPTESCEDPGDGIGGTGCPVE